MSDATKNEPGDVWMALVMGVFMAVVYFVVSSIVTWIFGPSSSMTSILFALPAAAAVAYWLNGPRKQDRWPIVKRPFAMLLLGMFLATFGNYCAPLPSFGWTALGSAVGMYGFLPLSRVIMREKRESGVRVS